MFADMLPVPAWAWLDVEQNGNGIFTHGAVLTIRKKAA